MRAAVVARHGGPEVIEIRDDWPEPGPPGEGEVLIDVAAAGLNPSDWKIRTFGPAELPYAAGRESAGTVAAVGPGVTGFAAGDEVFSFFGWHSRPGGHAEHTIVAADMLAHRPSGPSLHEAAAVPLAGLTAFQALRLLDIPAGERVVVTAGAGGVGHLAVQLAAHQGLEVIATAGPANHDFVARLGAATVVDYHDAGFAKQMTGAHYLLDAVGPTSIAAIQDELGTNARIVAVAGLPKDIRPDATSQAMRAQPDGADLAELAALMEQGHLTATVQEVFPLERLADAHRLLEDGHVRGKLVISVS